MSCTRLRCVLTQTPAPRPGLRLRRGRAEARAPVARKPCLLAPAGEGLKDFRYAWPGKGMLSTAQPVLYALYRSEHDTKSPLS
ncbi:SufE protein involved in Fe-S center assembly [Xanthomonas citri pv. mangiferaeindicae]|nr:SufE protein involved in Fe-S center assembly [Xanthomonas citri pv. mangiferaeindicae]